jgi:ABC-2 type transport system ATP-binding protein
VETAIKTTDLRKQFGKTEVLKGLDLSVPVGSVYGLLGRNGAGKTTTIQILMDIIRPTSGGLDVLGMDPQADSVALKHRIGYVSENPSLYGWMTVAEIVKYACDLNGVVDRAESDRLIDRFGLDQSAKVGSLSRGQAAQVGLVCALSHRPELLILDEPVSGLDVIVRQDFLESIVNVIQEEGRTVFLSSHLVHELERVADWIGIVDDGQLIVSDEIDSVKNSVKEVIIRGSEVAILPDTFVVNRENRTITVFDYDLEKLEQIKRAGAEVIEVTDLPLEQAFVAQVRRRSGGQG